MAHLNRITVPRRAPTRYAVELRVPAAHKYQHDDGTGCRDCGLAQSRHADQVMGEVVRTEIVSGAVDIGIGALVFRDHSGTVIAVYGLASVIVAEAMTSPKSAAE